MHNLESKMLFIAIQLNVYYFARYYLHKLPKRCTESPKTLIQQLVCNPIFMHTYLMG
jgi:hypothetical protein